MLIFKYIFLILNNIKKKFFLYNLNKLKFHIISFLILEIIK